jgi:cell division protein FtsB
VEVDKILYEILLAVLIVAVVYLILVLWRLFRILTNVDETVADLKVTSAKISEYLKNSAEHLSNLSANLGLMITVVEKVVENIKNHFVKNKSEDK